MMPATVDYQAYTSGHILWELQLLLFTGVGFFVLLKHVGGEPKISVDTDWVYRKAMPAVAGALHRVGGGAWQTTLGALMRKLTALVATVSAHHGPQGILARTWPTGSMVLWVAILLAASLLIYYL